MWYMWYRRQRMLLMLKTLLFSMIKVYIHTISVHKSNIQIVQRNCIEKKCVKEQQYFSIFYRGQFIILGGKLWNCCCYVISNRVVVHNNKLMGGWFGPTNIAQTQTHTYIHIYKEKSVFI